MSKLSNDPLLRMSISLVASEDGKRSGKSGSNALEEEKTQALSIAVALALLLVFTVGMVQLVLYFGFAFCIFYYRDGCFFFVVYALLCLL